MFPAREFSVARFGKGSTASPATVALFIGLLLTFVAFLLAQAHERRHDRTLFDAEVAQFMAALRQAFSASEVLLQSGAGTLAAHADMGANEWQSFVDGDDLKARFPGFRALPFSEFVPIKLGARVTSRTRWNSPWSNRRARMRSTTWREVGLGMRRWRAHENSTLRCGQEKCCCRVPVVEKLPASSSICP